MFIFDTLRKVDAWIEHEFFVIIWSIWFTQYNSTIKEFTTHSCLVSKTFVTSRIDQVARIDWVVIIEVVRIVIVSTPCVCCFVVIKEPEIFESFLESVLKTCFECAIFHWNLIVNIQAIVEIKIVLGVPKFRWYRLLVVVLIDKVSGEIKIYPFN